jgi:aspartyl-tRNA(Asn)/glutamyl-tRNA(Gln) amidotransferase subunit C
MSTVTLEEVRHVAELANLQLTPEEEPRMQTDLNAILAYVAQLGELDTTGIAPMAQVGDVLAAENPDTPVEQAGEPLRPDAIRPSVERKAVMTSAPETDGRFFKVPKVIER